MKIGIAVVAVLGLMGLFFLASTPAEEAADRAAEAAAFTPLASELFLGEDTAAATLIEYADFKCPSCGQYHLTTAQELSSEYGRDLKTAFRPVAVIGPDSERAAVGSYCADDQGLFTDYHDAVFAYMWDNYYEDGNFAAEFDDILSVDVLGSIVEPLGVNVIAFNSCLNDPEKAATVAGNLTRGRSDGFRGTPTFSVSGQTISGPQPANIFRSLIDIQLAGRS